METDAKFSLCKHKHFWKVRGKELFNVIFYTIKQSATLAQHSWKIYHAYERVFSNVIICPSHRISELPNDWESPGPSITLHPLLSHNLFLGSFTCMQKWVSVSWRAGRHPVVWFLLSLNIRHSVANEELPEKSCRLQSWKFHFYLSQLAWFFFFSSYCQYRKMTS